MTPSLHTSDPSAADALPRFLERAQAVAADCRNYLDPASLRPDRLQAQGQLLAHLERRAALDATAMAGCVGLLPPGVPPQSCLGIASVAALLQQGQAWSRDQVLLDGLAGDASFGAAIVDLDADAPRQIGCDASLGLADAGLRLGRTVLWSDLRGSLLRERIADYAVASHGLYRVPPGERAAFATALARRLRSGGRMLLLDFEPGSPTARWHVEFVAAHRSSGHPFRHYTRDGLVGLLRQAGLNRIETHRIYDPHVLRAQPGEGDSALLARFARRQIALYALDRLQPPREPVAAERIVAMAEPYFRVDLPGPLADHPLAADQLCLRDIDGQRCLIAPRLAIAAIGTRP